MNFKTNVLSIIIAFTLVLTGAEYYGTGFASAEAGGTAFTDLPSTHWAYESVKKMQEKEIIKGYADGTFRPAQTVTYGEFIKMTITALDGKDDVAEVATPTHWASKYYKAALDKNLFSSGQIAEKSLNLSIPRYDMALIAANAVNAGEVNNYEELMESLPDVDTKTVNSYQILQAYAEGMITGYEDSTFRAFGTLSRAGASAVIYRLIDKSARKVPSIGGTSKEEPAVSETPTTKTDADGTPALGSKGTDRLGDYTVVETAKYVTNWADYLTDEEPNDFYDVGFLNWTEKMKLYTTKMPYEMHKTWEEGTALATAHPSLYPEGPFLSYEAKFTWYMAFIVKDNKIVYRLMGDTGNFAASVKETEAVTMYINPNSYDYILFLHWGAKEGMNKSYENTTFDVATNSVPFMFANPFK